MARCVCCSRPLSSRRSPPSAGSPRRPPGCRSSCAAKVSTSSSSSPTTATWSCRTSRRSSSTFRHGRVRRGSASAITRSPAGCIWSTSRGWRAAIRTSSPTATVGRTTRSGSFASPERSRRVPCRRHPTCCTSTTGTPAPRSRRSTVQPPTVVSIHNLAYQGVAPGTWLRRIGPRAEHYEWWGGTNPLTGAFALGRRDRRGVAELRAGDPHAGVRVRRRTCRWRYRGDALTGILNGIDTEVWDPSTDPHIVSRFDADRPRSQGAQPRRAARAPRLRRRPTFHSPSPSPA